MRRTAWAFVLLAVLGGCAGDDGTGTTSDPIVPEPRLSDIQEKVFNKSCASFTSCHDRDSPAGHLDLTSGHSYGNLVNVPAYINADEIRVVPGFPDKSFLIQKLRNTMPGDKEHFGEAMPLRNPALADETIQAIEEWIAAGANDD